MKARHFCFTLLLISHAFAQNGQDSTLVAHYSFNGNVLDSSGNENHGTPYDLIPAQDRYGFQEAAYEFNGSSSYISIPNSESIQSPDSQITMMAWINMYGWSKTGSAFNPVLMKSSSQTNAFQYRLCITSTKALGISFNNWDTGRNSGNYGFKFFRWYFIAVTFKADTVRFYVDGNLINTLRFVVDMVQDTKPLEIGRDVPGVVEHFNGKIDEVRVYNRALTDAEIASFYNNYHSAEIFVRIENKADTLSSQKNRGLSWADFDKDNDLDLYISNYDNRNLFLKNEGNGNFLQDTSFIFVSDITNSRSAAWADFDNDNDLDLVLTNWSAPNELYVNNNDGTYTKNILSDLNRTSADCSWGDYDKDGFLDLFIANRDEPNELYHNNGDGTLTRIDSGSIVTDNRHSLCGTWIDFDEDGDLDMYVTNTHNHNNFLYSNNGDGTFERIDTLSITTEGQHGASCGWGDYDNDGDLDLFLAHANYGDDNYLYRNDGGGVFERIKNIAPTQDGGVSAGSCWGDIDNDGDLDLVVSNGEWLAPEKNFLYINQGNGEFERAEQDTFTKDIGQGQAITLVDWDKDGYLELIVANEDQHNFAYENSRSGNHWLEVKCIGTISNRSAIGSLIRIKSNIFGMPVWQLRNVADHNGRQSHPGLPVHFGLGDAAAIDTLIVEWPSGIIETYFDIETDQMITIKENEGIIGIRDENYRNRIPNAFILYQNFPNPFNPETHIRYNLTKSANVSLKIYDCLGREVKDLVNDRQSAGNYIIKFKADKLSSGIYFYRLKINGKIIGTRKMILLK